MCWLVWLLAPILTPFALAAMLGWLGDPLVDRLERAGRSRNVAVTLVFAAMALLVVLVAAAAGADAGAAGRHPDRIPAALSRLVPADRRAVGGEPHRACNSACGWTSTT